MTPESKISSPITRYCVVLLSTIDTNDVKSSSSSRQNDDHLFRNVVSQLLTRVEQSDTKTIPILLPSHSDGCATGSGRDALQRLLRDDETIGDGDDGASSSSVVVGGERTLCSSDDVARELHGLLDRWGAPRLESQYAMGTNVNPLKDDSHLNESYIIEIIWIVGGRRQQQQQQQRFVHPSWTITNIQSPSSLNLYGALRRVNLVPQGRATLEIMWCHPTIPELPSLIMEWSDVLSCSLRSGDEGCDGVVDKRLVWRGDIGISQKVATCTTYGKTTMSRYHKSTTPPFSSVSIYSVNSVKDDSPTSCHWRWTHLQIIDTIAITSLPRSLLTLLPSHQDRWALVSPNNPQFSSDVAYIVKATRRGDGTKDADLLILFDSSYRATIYSLTPMRGIPPEAIRAIKNNTVAESDDWLSCLENACNDDETNVSSYFKSLREDMIRELIRRLKPPETPETVKSSTAPLSKIESNPSSTPNVPEYICSAVTALDDATNNKQKSSKQLKRKRSKDTLETKQSYAPVKTENDSMLTPPHMSNNNVGCSALAALDDANMKQKSSSKRKRSRHSSSAAMVPFQSPPSLRTTSHKSRGGSAITASNSTPKNTHKLKRRHSYNPHFDSPLRGNGGTPLKRYNTSDARVVNNQKHLSRYSTTRQQQQQQQNVIKTTFQRGAALVGGSTPRRSSLSRDKTCNNNNNNPEKIVTLQRHPSDVSSISGGSVTNNAPLGESSSSSSSSSTLHSQLLSIIQTEMEKDDANTSQQVMDICQTILKGRGEKKKPVNDEALRTLVRVTVAQVQAMNML